MSEIQIFKNPQFGEIRIHQDADNEPWFCLTDVAKMLDLVPSKLTQRMSDDVLSKYPIIDVMGREQVANFINEDGLYDAILDSRKPEAKLIRKWVTSEVLPSIRKTGGYIAVSDDDTDAEIMAKALLVAKSTIERKNRRIEEQQKTIVQQENIIREKDIALENLNQKVGYLDRILASTSTVYTTQIAQDYGMSAKKFNALLKELKLQHKVGRQWILNSPHHTMGYVHSETITLGNGKTIMDTKWTQKGRLFLYERLKKKSILPLIETA